MRLAHPALLFFLFALVVPIVVHLFRLQRYKKVYFSNVRLLESLQNRQKRSARWREYLVLLSRMLLITCLVLAFARPYRPLSEETALGGTTAVSIYLDNSFSMQAPASEAVLLDNAKAQVANIVKAFPPDAAVQLLTNDFKGEDQVFRTPAQILARLPEIGFSALPRSFAEVAARQEELFSGASYVSDSRLCYYISDFQKSTIDLPTGFTPQANTRCVFVPLAGVPYSNLSLDSLSLDSPVLQAGQEATLKVWISNRSEQEQWQIPLRLFLDNRQVGAYPIDLKPGEGKMVELPLHIGENGENKGYVEIADYPVVFDNRLYFGFQAINRISVWHLYEQIPSEPIRRVFESDSAFDYRLFRCNNLDYGQLRAARLIVTDGLRDWPSALVAELERFVRGGGSLYILPPAPAFEKDSLCTASLLVRNLTGDAYGAFRREETGVRQIESRHPVFALALQQTVGQEKYPQVKGYYPLPESGKGAYRSLMQFSSGFGQESDFLRVYSVGNGYLYLLSTPLEDSFTDFSQHYTFVVSLLNMALHRGGNLRLYHTIGGRQGIYLPSSLFADLSETPLFHILSDNGAELDLIPAVRRIGSETALFEYGRITEAGHYTVCSGKISYPLPFNHDRAESETECYGAEDIAAWIKASGQKGLFVMSPADTDLSRSVEHLNGGQGLWKVFLIFALVFALLETLCLRGWSGNRPFTQKTKGKS